MSVESIITENMDIWTSAIKTKSTSGRGSSNKFELYGIKKLRELILELAIRGKLVSQNSDDEAASEILKKVEERKFQLIKDKKVKKAKSLPPISSDEIPFQLPPSWQWCRFSELLDFSGGGQPPKSFFSETMLEGYVQLIQIRDLGPNPQPVYIPKEKASKFCSEDDIMVGRYGASVGKVFWGKEGAYNVALVKIHNDFKAYTPSFIFLLLSSPLGQSFFGGVSRSAQDGFNKNDIAPKLIPLLSFEEQNRIVAKVNELMALCDQLESQTEASIEAHQTLVKSLLETLTNAKDADELNESWQRISVHFDVLFTTEESIDQLKQTILQLAVMGKLVKQDPNDEPASKLLGRIAIEKEKLIKDKKIKKQKSLHIISHTEMRYELPSGWVLARFSDFVNEVATGPFGSMIHKSDYIDGGIPLINPSHMVNGFIKHDSAISVTELKAKELASYKLREGDLVMARRGEMGRSALVTAREDGWLCGTGSFVLNFNDEVSRKFLLILFKTNYVKSYLGGNSVGSTMTNLNHGILNKMPIMVPPVNEQREIAQKVECLFTICENLRKKIVNLKHTETQLADSIVTVQ